MTVALGLLAMLLAGRLWLARRLDLAAEEALTWACEAGSDLDCASVGWLTGVLARRGEALPMDPELALRAGGILLSGVGYALLLRATPHPRLLALALLAAPGLGLLGFTTTEPPLIAALWALCLVAAQRGRAVLASLPALLILLCLPDRATPSPVVLLDLIRQAGPMAIPGAAWLLHGLARPPSERADRWALGGALLGTLASFVSGLPSLMAIPALSAIFALSRATPRWQVGLGTAAGPGLLLSLALFAHHLQPLGSLDPDPRASFVGGRSLGEAVAAWGRAEVYAQDPQDAAWIRFYGGLPVRSGSPPPGSEGLYVRPFAAAPPPFDRTRHPFDGPNDVTAWLDGPRPGQTVLVHRWQVYALQEPQ